MQKFSESISWSTIVWLVSTVLALTILTGFGRVLSHAAMQTTVVTMPARAAFSSDWSKQFSKGKILNVARERSMPAGYERIYLHQDGAVVGSLPESPLTRRVRGELASGHSVKTRILGFNPLFPSRALTVQVIFG